MGQAFPTCPDVYASSPVGSHPDDLPPPIMQKVPSRRGCDDTSCKVDPTCMTGTTG